MKFTTPLHGTHTTCLLPAASTHPPTCPTCHPPTHPPCAPQGKCPDNPPVVMVRADRNQFSLHGDLLDLADRACKDYIPVAKDENNKVGPAGWCWGRLGCVCGDMAHVRGGTGACLKANHLGLTWVQEGCGGRESLKAFIA